MIGPGFASAVGARMIVPLMIVVAVVFGIGLMIGWML
jgi:uncharacterized membrane protein YciS (DUF1049 family)